MALPLTVNDATYPDARWRRRRTICRVNPYKMAGKQDDQEEQEHGVNLYKNPLGWDGEDKKTVYGKAGAMEEKLTKNAADKKPVSGKGPGPKMPVLPRQLRHMHRLHANKKHAQADKKRRRGWVW